MCERACVCQLNQSGWLDTFGLCAWMKEFGFTYKIKFLIFSVWICLYLSLSLLTLAHRFSLWFPVAHSQCVILREYVFVCTWIVRDSVSNVLKQKYIYRDSALTYECLVVCSATISRALSLWSIVKRFKRNILASCLILEKKIAHLPFSTQIKN